MQNPEKESSSKRPLRTFFPMSFPLNYVLYVRTVERPHQITVASLSFDTLEANL